MPGPPLPTESVLIPLVRHPSLRIVPMISVVASRAVSLRQRAHEHRTSPLSLHKEILKCRPPLLYDSPDSENSHEAVSSAGEEAIVSTLEIVRNLDTME